jgi:hypothetical protein
MSSISVIKITVLELDEEKLNEGTLRSAKRRAELTYQLLAKMLKCDGEVSSDDLKTFCTTQEDVCFISNISMAWDFSSNELHVLSVLNSGFGFNKNLLLHRYPCYYTVLVEQSQRQLYRRLAIQQSRI